MLENDPRLKSLPDAPGKPADGPWTRIGEIPLSTAPTRASARPKRREKVFGAGRGRPLDRNARARLMHLARALTRRTEKGKHYGRITAKAFAILEALLWTFHNAKDGRCFPSYLRIAEAAGCSPSTVAGAIKALEAAGLMSWDNRIARIRERCPDLLGPNGWRWRIIRTSNAYKFNDPASESKNKPGTTTPDSIASLERPESPKKALGEGLAASFEHLWTGIQRKTEAKIA